MESKIASLASIFSLFLITLPFRLYYSSLETVFILLGIVILYSFVKSTITNNASQIDEMWSILPSFICFFLVNGSARSYIMFLLVLIWGSRLSFNFARKGGYAGLEDYRWAYVKRAIPGKVLWHLFNFFFVSVYQTFLLFSLCLPVYFEPRTPLDFFDLLSAASFLTFLAVECTADQQQWNFQTNKHRKIAAGEKVEKQFLDFGLFRYSRHPNFFAEICIWWSFASFAKGVYLAGTGALLLNLLFLGSVWLTEWISVGKYPEYRNYQKTTSRLVPWFNLGKVD